MQHATSETVIYQHEYPHDVPGSRLGLRPTFGVLTSYFCGMGLW